MKPNLLLGLLASFLALALFGCTSSSVSQYTAPRVTGRVLDANTRQPLADTTVLRLGVDQERNPREPGHGGQVMDRPPAVETDRKGNFSLNSVRNVTLFGSQGWYSVTVVFYHAGYQPFQTNYTIGCSTNLNGEPCVMTGDIGLQPLPK
jgi:hypothetical protein